MLTGAAGSRRRDGVELAFARIRADGRYAARDARSGAERNWPDRGNCAGRAH